MERVMTLRLDPRCRARLLLASRAAAPAEACGLLVGRRAGAEVVVLDAPALRNVAARPEREFALDPGEVVALHDAARDAGAEIVGAWLLLWDRTKLFGVAILLPVMVNIIVFDIIFLDTHGATASATIGVGVGANALIGGSSNSVTLQPLSVEGTTGLNVAGGVAAMTLVPAR